MRLFKYHGLGNDFLIADLRTGDTAPSVQDPATVRALCARHFGIGADGILAILPAQTEHAHARMRVLNSDGGEAEMCGNGLRCVAKYLVDRDPKLSGVAKHCITIDTGAGPLACTTRNEHGEVATVSVDMGRPILDRELIPMSRDTGPAGTRAIDVDITLPEATLPITAVSMGNPHAVHFVAADSDEDLRAMAQRLGPTVERHAMFPQFTNVEFARMHSPTAIELVVWERGCGITLACGTGACATGVAACVTGRSTPGEDITVTLPGGGLTITVGQDLERVIMRGPARHVCDVDVAVAKYAAVV